MFRKSALAMAMLGALSSSGAMALGLGEIELKSALNQPLNAEVELLSATEAELDELKVEIGSSQAFANAGIERPLFLTRMRFSVARNAEGKPVIRVTSRDVVREPFLDFLLEISWSKGRLLREYTVLVDPPVTMPAPAPVAQAPAARPAPAPAGRVTHTAQLPPVAVLPGEYGPTKRNDTLWKIAQQVRPDAGVSVEQTMMGLLRANPEAFVDNNINNLKAGYVLRVPDREELTSMSRREALAESRAQYAAWRQARAGGAPVAQSVPVGAPPATDVAPVAESSLQLVAPEEAAGSGGLEGAATLDGVQRELMMANEALEAQRRQSEEMSGRLSMLEEQIVNMQRLIQLKDDELARLQAQSADAGVEALPAETMDAVTGEAVAESAPEAAVAEVPAEVMEVMPGENAPQAMVSDAPDVMTDMDAAGVPAGEPVSDDELSDEVAEAMAAIDAETDAMSEGLPGVPAPVAAPVPAPEATPAPQAAAPAVPQTLTPPGLVDRLLENPLWLGAGGAVLALLAFFGLRRRRGVETEFQESILQASQDSMETGDSEIVAAESQSTESKSAESSLLSEFAVSDMGSLKSDGEADPLAEADVYLAYGRFRQAEELIKDALARDAERDDLNLKLLEVFLAGKNQAAFDEHAQGILARLENSKDPLWEKVAEMGRELDPENPLYQPGEDSLPSMDSLAADQGIEALSAEEPAFDAEPDVAPADAEVPKDTAADEGLDFDLDLSFDAKAGADDSQPDSMEFTPPEIDAEAAEPAPDAKLDVDMDSVEPDAVEQDNALEFDLEGFDMDAVSEAADEEPQGDGELADMDEVSTKLDLARAYIDMGDPDGARSILDEVMEEGSDDQKGEAREIMAQMS